MVIDRNETVAPLFWYLYRPMVVSRRDDNHAAGGFNVALYPDNTLVFCKFDGLNRMVDRCTFQLGPEVIGEYMTILESQSWWMGKLPREIRTDGRASYTCMFGFTRSHPLFACEDINTLVLAPFNSQRGMYARRLRNMLECMAEMFFNYGIELGVNSFSWQWDMISPLESMQATPVQAAQRNWDGQSGQYYSATQFPQDGASYYEQQERIAQ